MTNETSNNNEEPNTLVCRFDHYGIAHIVEVALPLYADADIVLTTLLGALGNGWNVLGTEEIFLRFPGDVASGKGAM